jgi:hypothetical protein
VLPLFRPATPPLLLFTLLLAASALAQSTFPLAGRVTNAATGEPLPRARVLAARRDGPTVHSAVAFTDSTGAFRFPALPAGQYSLRVQKPGFAPNSLIPFRPLDLSAPVETLAYALVPFGVISGQLLDADGEPLPLMKVQLHAQRFSHGRPFLALDRSATTDDRGHYRFAGLPAGRYLVRAVSRAGGAFLSANESAPPSVGRRAFAPVYAGNIEQAAQATPTDLAPGQHVQHDFRLTLLPAARVRGVLAGLRPATPVYFEVALPGREPIEPRVFLNPASGVFTIFDLLPATYQLRVRHGNRDEPLAAEATVTASPEPAPPIHLPLLPPPTLTLQLQTPTPSPCTIILSPPDPVRGSPVSLRPGQPAAVPPGEYEVLANCFGIAIDSLLLGSTDLLLARRLTITPGTASATLTLTPSPDNAKLLIQRAPAVLATQVLLVPGAASLGAPTLHDFGGRPRALLPLRPGDYTAYALPSADLPYRDPAFLAKLRGGIPVRVEPQRSTTVTLSEVSLP